MPEYVVRWEIDLTADDPRDAARHAREAQLDPETTAVVFEVWPRDAYESPDDRKVVDLDDPEAEG
jgi:hypothetical protein